MNLRSSVVIESVKNNHTFRFDMPIGSQFPDCLSALNECIEAVNQLQENARKQEEASAAQAPKAE